MLLLKSKYLGSYTMSLFVLHYFCVCGAKNIARCLIIVKTTFYTVRPTKKFSLKRSFYEAVFTCFF